MATSLCSALATLALLQGAPDSVGTLWTRVQHDSGDARAWFELGRAYVRLSAGYHAHRGQASASPAPDTAWARAVLDTAADAFAQAARLGAGTRQGDSARVFRVFVVGDKAFLAWELGGVEAAAQTWGALADELKLPPVLEELGENLLRACPREGVLLTAGDSDTYAAWYMRFARGLRPDLLILPLAVWRSDPVFRGRVARELKLPAPPRRGADDAPFRTLAARRPVCASLAFAPRPDERPRLRWSARPLVWVAGPTRSTDRVPPRDFVFAALRLALDENQTWTRPVLEIYRRAAGLTPSLCEPFRIYGLRQEVGCR